MAKNKWVFIVNPIAGNGDGKAMIPVLEEKLDAFNIRADIEVTERPGHASELTEIYASKGYDHIIGVGGDGTMNEIGRILINKQGIVTGLIPAGTGNDFNQILGFPDRYEDEHWEIFFQETVIKMDYGLCNGIPFFNGMGLGFDAEVATKNYVAPGETKMGGKGKYLKAILGTLFFFKEYNVSISSEGKTEKSLCFINTISNGRRIAGGFYLTPLAIANDGRLDVCMIKKLGLLKRLDILTKVPKGIHINDKKVNYYTTDKIEVDFGQKVPFHADGEVHFGTKFTVEVFQQKLPVIFNPGGKHHFNMNLVND